MLYAASQSSEGGLTSPSGYLPQKSTLLGRDPILERTIITAEESPSIKNPSLVTPSNQKTHQYQVVFCFVSFPSFDYDSLTGSLPAYVPCYARSFTSGQVSFPRHQPKICSVSEALQCSAPQPTTDPCSLPALGPSIATYIKTKSPPTDLVHGLVDFPSRISLHFEPSITIAKYGDPDSRIHRRGTLDYASIFYHQPLSRRKEDRGGNRQFTLGELWARSHVCISLVLYLFWS